MKQRWNSISDRNNSLFDVIYAVINLRDSILLVKILFLFISDIVILSLSGNRFGLLILITVTIVILIIKSGLDTFTFRFLLKRFLHIKPFPTKNYPAAL